MSVTDFGTLATIANSLSVTVLLVIVVVALARGVVVTKGHHEAVIKELDRQIGQTERRADGLQEERAQLLKQLDANSQSLYRFTDVIGELRDAVRDLTRARTAP